MTVSSASAEHGAISLFSVHAPQDASLQHRLEKHLSPLKRQGVISIRSVDTIPAGADRAVAIEKYLNQAQIILLLISAEFIASDHLHSIMTYALQKKEEGHTHVISILLRPLDWEMLPVSQLSGFLLNRRPVREAKRIKYPVKETWCKECRGTIVQGRPSVGRGFPLEPWPSWLSGPPSDREW